VASLDEAVAKVEANGGKIVMPRTTVPEVGYLAYCQDSEGNTLGMMEPMQVPACNTILSRQKSTVSSSKKKIRARKRILS